MDDSINIPLKRCKTCGNEYPATNQYFANRTASNDGLQFHCKSCMQARYRAKHPMRTDDVPEGYKRCTQCLQVFPSTTDHFFSDTRTPGALRARCKSCTHQNQHKLYPYTPAEGTYRVCKACGQSKPATLEYFHANRTRRDGLRTECKECVKADHVVRRTRSQYPAEGTMKRCSKCGIEKPATREHFYSSRMHLDHLTPHCKQCGESELPQARIYNRNYYRVNHSRLRANNKRYRASRPEAILDYHRRRRARKLNAGGTHTLQDIQDQYRRQKGKCYYCKKKLNGKYEVDHIVPLARGGTDDKWNLVVACEHCNKSKNDRLLHEWGPGGMLL